MSVNDKTQPPKNTNNKWQEIYDSEEEENLETPDTFSTEDTVSETLEDEIEVKPESEEVLSYEDLQNRLKLAEEKAEKATQQVQYAVAELQTARRLATQREKFLIEKELKALLPVIDSLDTCKASLSTNTSLEQLKEGVDLILKLMADVFKKWGVAPIQPAIGDAFDANCHAAISVQEAKDQKAGTILELLQKGYYLHDRVIRAAMVVVTK